MGGKRSSSPSRGPRYDETLATATRALRNLTHANDGHELTSGAFDSFPPPGLRLKGEPADLPLAPTQLTLEALKRHGKTMKASEGLGYAVVNGRDIGQRNPRWLAFVDGIVASAREPLGISSAARVSATLRQLVLLQPGAEFGDLRGDELERTGRKPRGVFGSLVIALPGEFTGGDLISTREAGSPKVLWHPASASDNTYGISYGAFYDGALDGTKVEPISTGLALWLVYDLVTSTVHEVPRFAGRVVLENAFEASLTQFFEVLPVTKRLKISDDAWRNIHEFATDHRFVYPVKGDAFETLEGEDGRMAERLAAFCAKSGGQYVLYLAAFHCRRECYSRYDDSDSNHTVFLDSPWYRQGDESKLPFPYTNVCHRKELAPAGFLKVLRYDNEYVSEHSDSSDSDDSDRSYYDRLRYDDDDDDGYYRKTSQHHSHALVVQPATLERALWARAPLPNAFTKLTELIQTAPDEAVRLARQMLKNRPFTSNRHTHFARFLEIVETLNEVSLFSALLSGVSSYEFDEKLLPRAVRHFGWDMCVDAVEQIIANRSFGSGVNLVGSLLHDVTETDRIDRVVRVLARRVPWTNQSPHEVADRPYFEYMSGNNSNVEDLSRLFALAHRSSIATLLNLIGNPNAGQLTVHLIAPALVRFVSALSASDKLGLLPLVRLLRDKIEASLPAVRNSSYAKCPVYTHCAKCLEIREFLLSPTAQQVSITVRNKAQLKHVETTVKRKVQPTAPMTILSTTPNTVLLTKQTTSNTCSTAVEACVALLSSLLDPAA